MSRFECEIWIGNRQCGKPAVDYILIAGDDDFFEGRKMWLGAIHYDEWASGRPIRIESVDDRSVSNGAYANG